MITHISAAKRYKAVAVDEMHRYGTSKHLRWNSSGKYVAFT